MSDDGLIRGETGAQRMLNYVLDVSAGHNGEGRCHLTLDERHANRHGRMHGGVAASLLDTAMGAAASLTVDGTGTAPFLTLTMTVNYISSGVVGDVLTARARVTGGGHKTKFVEAELHTDGGRLVANAVGVFRPVPKSRREGPAAER